MDMAPLGGQGTCKAHMNSSARQLRLTIQQSAHPTIKAEHSIICAMRSTTQSQCKAKHGRLSARRQPMRTAICGAGATHCAPPRAHNQLRCTYAHHQSMDYTYGVHRHISSKDYAYHQSQ